MKSMGQMTSGLGWLRARFGIAFLALAMLTALGLFGASPSLAAYQQVGTFAGNPGELHPSFNEPKFAEQWPEKVQLGGVGGMAINYTGAGGVPAGTLYGAGRFGTGTDVRIARYSPDLSFSESWKVRTRAQEEESEGKGEEPYERCGPDGEPTHLTCLPRVQTSAVSELDVDVDQTTGNVYVYVWQQAAGTPLVTEYSPDGSEVIARFGIRAATDEKVQESPDKIHGTGGAPIAVNGAGEVYVFDLDGTDNFYHRLMVFKPKTPGDYTEYEYAGQGHDIAAGFLNETQYPAKPVTDAAGYLYVAGYDHVEKYDPAHPGDPPICSFAFKKGGILSMTVNPLTGQAFFFAGNNDKKLHQLSACVEGKFSEVGIPEFSPKREVLSAMAVDPVSKFETGGQAGILYAGAPDGSGGETKGQSPNTEVESSMGYIFAPPNEVPPVVVSESVRAVTQTSARLEGEVDPKSNSTTYVFQYISEDGYQENEPAERFAGAGEAPVGGAVIEGAKAVAAAATVSGLQPGSKYHVRILATSHCLPGDPEKECVAKGEGRAFRTYPSASPGLPDHRAYELVSPTEKNGGQVFPANPTVSSCLIVECKPGAAYNTFPMQSAPDGEAVAYAGSAFSFDEGALIENQYVAHRTASGWQTTNPTPSLLLSKGGGGYQAFTADLSKAVLEQQGRPLSALGPQEFGNLYTQPSEDPLALTPLLSEAPPNRDPGNTSNNKLRLSYAGASADFSHLFFSANDALLPEAEGGPEAKTNLYESSGGELHLVNFAPGDSTTLPGAVFGSGKLLGRGDPNNPESFIFHAISPDGSRAFWTSEEDGRLYVREDGQTLLIPDPNSCATSLKPDERTCFLTAAADGSKVVLSDGRLFDVENLAAPPVDLTQGLGGFEGLAGQSEDLSRIYFADTAVLTGEEENEYGDKAEVGKANLYAWHEGTTTFIATLLSDPAGSRSWELAPVHRSASASPDGRWLTFVSQAPLTGFGNTGLCESESGTEVYFEAPCAEVFIYQAETGELRCPSCNVTETAPHGPSGLLKLPGNTPALPPPRYLTNSGRLFFDSQDSLSPFDTNGRVEDVYELEPNGVGSCTSQTGCVRLISGGRSGYDSNFLAADPSGKNVFFTSRDKLVPVDVDALLDLYDAREGGGFPPEARSAECQGEACLPSVSPPNHPASASIGFRGPGNETTRGASKRCPKGRHVVKKKGKARCVKRKPKRHRQRTDNNRGGPR